MKKNTSYYSGTSNLVLPFPKKHFPEPFRDKSRLEYYGILFNSLEVNSSFYKTPQAATVGKWAAAVPDHFRFSFKLSKEITHAKGFNFNEELIESFMKAIAPAEKRKGMLLIQLPPSVTIDKLDRLQLLLKEIDWHNENGWDMAIEFRHASWYEKETYEILQEFKAAVVLHDMPASTPPEDVMLSENIFIRFHGPGGKYRGSYEDEFLLAKAKQIRAWLKKGKTVYAYFNNTMGDALKDLERLNKLVKSGR